MGMKLSGRRDAISDINVTPLVDVMLVLLIIFMVTATLLRTKDEQERLVDMELPQTVRQRPVTIDPEDRSRLILRIDENLVVRLDDQLVTDCSQAARSGNQREYEPCFREIQENLRSNQRLLDAGQLYIMGEETVPYGFVVGTIARIRLAGVDRVGMITNPEYLLEESN
ncbi:MAG: biopolymer transporter ExbD [Bradymonadales bacterium]|nr:biopolymer transporter ExbD [Bradymonadales bacterium]